MALQNRVTPTSEIIAECGARHARWATAASCTTRPAGSAGRAGATRTGSVAGSSFQGRKRRVMTPGRYTELFFLDEATALAAGHPPLLPSAGARISGHSRRRGGAPSALRRGHLPRRSTARSMPPGSSRAGRRQIRFEAALDDLPDGAFALLADDRSTPLLVPRAPACCPGIHPATGRRAFGHSPSPASCSRLDPPWRPSRPATYRHCIRRRLAAATVEIVGWPSAPPRSP